MSDNTSKWSSRYSTCSSCESVFADGNVVHSSSNDDNDDTESCKSGISSATYTVENNHLELRHKHGSSFLHSSIDEHLEVQRENLCRYCGKDVFSHIAIPSTYSDWIARKNMLNHEFDVSLMKLDSCGDVQSMTQYRGGTDHDNEDYHTTIENYFDSTLSENFKSDFIKSDHLRSNEKCFTFNPQQVVRSDGRALQDRDNEVSKHGGDLERTVSSPTERISEMGISKNSFRNRSGEGNMALASSTSDSVAFSQNAPLNSKLSEQIMGTYTKTALLRQSSEGHTNEDHAFKMAYFDTLHRRSESLVESIRNGKVVYPKVLKAYIDNVKDVVSCPKFVSSDSISRNMSISRDETCDSGFSRDQNQIKDRVTCPDKTFSDSIGTNSREEVDHVAEFTTGHQGNDDKEGRKENKKRKYLQCRFEQNYNCMETVLTVYADRFLKILDKHTTKETSRKASGEIKTTYGQNVQSSAYFPNADKAESSNIDREQIRKAFCKRLGLKSKMLSLIENFHNSHSSCENVTFEPRLVSDEEVKRLLVSLENVSHDKALHEALRLAIATVHVLMQSQGS